MAAWRCLYWFRGQLTKGLWEPLISCPGPWSDSSVVVGFVPTLCVWRMLGFTEGTGAVLSGARMQSFEA